MEVYGGTAGMMNILESVDVRQERRQENDQQKDV
jgi:hypothetical protein